MRPRQLAAIGLAMACVSASAVPTHDYDPIVRVGIAAHFSGALVQVSGGTLRKYLLDGLEDTPQRRARFGFGIGHQRDWRFASVTKQIVAVAVMQQVEAGRLALDAPVQRYAPALRIANADRITIRQLLQHTSGLPNPEDGPQADGQLVQYSRAAPKPAPGLSPICRAKAKAEPGAGFSYNNCDYEVLGAVLETVTRTPLATLLQQRVFAPAGMTRTRLLAPGDDAGRPGFDAQGHDDHAIDPGRFGAAGALAGPPSDLARFDRALMDGRLLKPETRAEMWRGDPKLGYAALGAWVYDVKLAGCATPQHIVERRGEVGGMQVRNIIAPDRGIAVIAFADHPVEFGEPWQGKGLTYDLMRAALCPA